MNGQAAQRQIHAKTCKGKFSPRQFLWTDLTRNGERPTVSQPTTFLSPFRVRWLSSKTPSSAAPLLAFSSDRKYTYLAANSKMQASRLEERTIRSIYTALRLVGFCRPRIQLNTDNVWSRKNLHGGHLGENGGNARGSDRRQQHTPNQSGRATVVQARLESQTQRGPGGEYGEAEGNGRRQVDVSLELQI